VKRFAQKLPPQYYFPFRDLPEGSRRISFEVFRVMITPPWVILCCQIRKRLKAIRELCRPDPRSGSEILLQHIPLGLIFKNDADFIAVFCEKTCLGQKT
jgi:hypothetical protein